jgi:hypothetical protein
VNAKVSPIRKEKPQPVQPRLFPKGTPVQLSPIAWGTRDPVLARGICRHVLEATPPREIAFDPSKEAHLRRTLRSYGMSH